MAPDITLFPIQQTMPSPLISVIVPIYNMESLLPRCLDSLAAQTLRDLEIIAWTTVQPTGPEASSGNMLPETVVSA